MSRDSLLPSKPQPKLNIRPLGSLDLLVVVLVVLTAWLRTPVGELGGRLVSWATDADLDSAALTSYFLTGPLSPEVLQADQDAWLPDLPPAPEDGFPEPWRTAARRLAPEDLPSGAVQALATLEPTPADDQLVAALDVLYEGDPLVALERLALGDELRGRAIKRARASGAANPEAYSQYRRFLPSADQVRADELVLHVAAVSRTLHIYWPVQGTQRISSAYGMRQHPIYDKPMFHNGIDVAIPIGTPMHAIQAGTVVSVGSNDRSGIYVSIRHADGVRSTYCHLDESLVEKGDLVERGEIFAKSGNTGGSTGPHLHFIVRVDEKTVDPLPLRTTAFEEAPEPAAVESEEQPATPGP